MEDLEILAFEGELRSKLEEQNKRNREKNKNLGRGYAGKHTIR